MRWVGKLQNFMTRPWYIPLVAFFAAFDAFFWVVPIDALLIARVLVNKRHWWFAALVIALGSAGGAALLGWAVEGHSGGLTLWLERRISPAEWRRATQFIQAHGAWGLALVSVGPIPQQPAVIVASLAHAPVTEIFLSTFGARVVKYELFAALAAFAPHALMKFKFVRRDLAPT